MSKAVLYSIRPEYCKLILDGKKTVEVRKSIPKLDVPFKCYIYCTYGFGLIEYKDEVLPNHLLSQKVSANKKWDNCCNGKVIGAFVCDFVYEFDEESHELRGPSFDSVCLTPKELFDYGNGKYLYGLKISNLIIYDEPKDLTDFFVEGECYPPRCSKCKYFDKGNGYNVEDDCLLPYHLNEDGNDVKPLFKAPQSWCYVEEVV